MSLYLRMVVCAYCIMLGANSAWAVDDPRMQVWVTSEDGSRLSVKEAIAKALPVLWDRVLLKSSRHRVSDKKNATSFLLRAAPEAEGVQVTFNPTRVWQYLEKKEVPFIREPLRVRLHIQLLNQNGMNMSESAKLLQQYADEIVAVWGIVPDPTAPALVLSWRWFDETQFDLTVRGHPKVPESHETRSFMSGDPQVQLQAWLQEALLKARDESAVQEELASTQEEPELPMYQQDEPLKLLLTIERKAALPEQISLEEALRQHPQVVALTAKYLSVNNQQYWIQFKEKNNFWMVAWLEKYGLRSTKGPSGWLAR
ncbi:MAG: hypothetical protein R8K22_05865 [Mariprofundaceae bacterium]